MPRHSELVAYGIAAMLLYRRVAYRVGPDERREMVARALGDLDRMDLPRTTYEATRALLTSFLSAKPSSTIHRKKEAEM
jgi:hypothetical protein